MELWSDIIKQNEITCHFGIYCFGICLKKNNEKQLSQKRMPGDKAVMLCPSRG